MREAMTARTSEAPVAVIDLALPHDVAPSVVEIPGCHARSRCDALADERPQRRAQADVAAVKRS